MEELRVCTDRCQEGTGSGTGSGTSSGTGSVLTVLVTAAQHSTLTESALPAHGVVRRLTNASGFRAGCSASRTIRLGES